MGSMDSQDGDGTARVKSGDKLSLTSFQALPHRWRSHCWFRHRVRNLPSKLPEKDHWYEQHRARMAAMEL